MDKADSVTPTTLPDRTREPTGLNELRWAHQRVRVLEGVGPDGNPLPSDYTLVRMGFERLEERSAGR
jgi:hypothetical protein